MRNRLKGLVNYLSLFGSLSTLFCCALPVLLVSIGMGATFASMTALVPQIHIVTAHKDLLFALTGALLLISYFLKKKASQMACPIDDKAQICQDSKSFSDKIFTFTLIIYAIGALFSYILPLVMF